MAEVPTATYLQTVTFRLPRTFRRAVASSLGRVGEVSTLSEAETFIREAVAANAEALIEEHTERKSVLKIRRRRKIRA